MTDTIICPLLLAAGESRRFGADKLSHLFSYQNETQPLILHSIKPWLQVFEKINIVVRLDNKKLLDILCQPHLQDNINIIVADNAADGMSASLMSGIKAMPDVDAWLIGLADMPFLDSNIIHQSVETLQNGADITVPYHNGKRGHPVGFAASFKSQLLSLSGDKGAKEILAAAAAFITTIQTDSNAVHRDIDTLSDLNSGVEPGTVT